MNWTIWTWVSYVAVAALGWLVAWGLKAAFTHAFKDSCAFGHRKKKYVKLGYRALFACDRDAHSFHGVNEWWATIGTWMCESCQEHGEDCFGTSGWWKVEFGNVVLDEKKMSDPPKDLESPKQFLERREKAQAASGSTVTLNDVLDALKTLGDRIPPVTPESPTSKGQEQGVPTPPKP